MDCGAVGTAAAGIVNATVTSINQRLFLVSGAEAVNPQQYQQARSTRCPRASEPLQSRRRFVQVCRDLAETKSKLERATDDLMSSKAAYQALEDQVRSLRRRLWPRAHLLGSFKKRRRRRKAGEFSCWAETKSRPSCKRR